MLSGSVGALSAASQAGAEIKVAIGNLCDDLSDAAGMERMPHEMIVKTHSEHPSPHEHSWAVPLAKRSLFELWAAYV